MKRPEFHEWRPHPWHGLEAGRELPVFVNAYIEITPFDLIKYEIDKASGYLRVDRPQRTSSQPPSLYGFVPQTYCGAKVAAHSHAFGAASRSGRCSAALAAWTAGSAFARSARTFSTPIRATYSS